MVHFLKGCHNLTSSSPLYRISFGFIATATSPNMVSGLVVDTTIS